MKGKQHRIAFCGVSGTGKTTTAQAVAEALGLPLCPVGARSVAAEMGFASPYDVDAAGRRGEFQARLQDAKLAWELEHDEFVTDRSSLDDLAYAALHGARELTKARWQRGLKHARERYTLWVFCPMRAFHNVGDDAARVPVEGSAYHEVTETTLLALAVNAFPSPFSGPDRIRLDNGEHEARVAMVREWVEEPR